MLLTVATRTIMPFGVSSIETASIGASVNLYRMAPSIKFTSKLISDNSKTFALVRLKFQLQKQFVTYVAYTVQMFGFRAQLPINESVAAMCLSGITITKSTSFFDDFYILQGTLG